MIGLLGGNWGYTDAEGNKVSALRDMTDGGGAGRYGDTFEGGPISGLLNDIGVRPRGYQARQERMADLRANAPAPQQRPTPNPAMPPLRPVGMNPVTPYGEAARFGLLAPAPNVAYEAPSMPPVVPNENLGVMRPPAFADPQITSRSATTAGPDSKSYANFLAYLKANGVEYEAVPQEKLGSFYNAWKNIGGI